MFLLIDEYLTLTKYDTERKGLFSYNQYNELKERKIHKREDRNGRYDWDYFSPAELKTLLDRFYEEVIIEIYGLKEVEKNHQNSCLEIEQTIEKISLGDTRHLAFCSLMMQGYSPLTIATIGDHKLVDTQLGYCCHLKTFAMAKVDILSKQIKLRLNRNPNNINAHINSFSGRDGIIKIMESETNSTSPDKIGFEIEGTVCISDNFPNACPPLTPCSQCLMHRIDNETDINQLERKAMIQFEEEIGEIEKIVNTLIALIVDKRNSNKAELFSQVALQLDSHINKASITKANL